MLECSPGARWAEEFESAGDMGFAYVELLAERIPDPANPIWSAEGRVGIRSACARAGLDHLSLCMNEPLDLKFAGPETSTRLAARLRPVFADLALSMLVLPLLEASDLNELQWEPVAQAVRLLAAEMHRHRAKVALELSLSAVDSLRFLDVVASAHVGLCYDVGNATALGLHPEVEIPMLGPHLWHIHAKDKDQDGTNVRLGTGRVAFAAVFDELLALGYDGGVTLETTRGSDPIATAHEHRSFLLGHERRAGQL